MNPALSLAAARVAVGVMALARPEDGSRMFRLDVDANAQLPLMTRLFGAREIALGAATLLARGRARTQLVGVGVAVDAADPAAAFLAAREGYLPRTTALMIGTPAVLAVGAGLAGIRDS